MYNLLFYVSFKLEQNFYGKHTIISIDWPYLHGEMWDLTLSRKLRNSLNLLHICYRKESYMLHYLLFETVTCSSMFKFIVMCRVKFFNCFYARLRNSWKSQIQYPRNIKHFFQVCSACERRHIETLQTFALLVYISANHEII